VETAEYTSLIASIKDTAYRLALRIVGDSSLAEDILQDVYEKVWRARDAVLHSEHPRAYVCRITHNLAIDRLRERGRERGIYIDRYGATDGNAQADFSDMAALTQQIIATLPPKQQLIIHMRDVEGYEFDEIAAIAECDETSVRMNLSRARKRVREELINAMNYGVR
jgi:RNA polymerase sigma-70 factor (ECF subfamily)